MEKGEKIALAPAASRVGVGDRDKLLEIVDNQIFGKLRNMDHGHRGPEEIFCDIVAIADSILEKIRSRSATIIMGLSLWADNKEQKRSLTRLFGETSLKPKLLARA